MSLTDSEILRLLHQLSATEFERFIAALWERQNWETEVTAGSSDRGIDVISTRQIPYPEKILIQAKCYQSGNKVGSPQIREYYALKEQESNVDQVLVITTSQFTSEARSVGDDLNVKCINGLMLARLIQREEADDLLRKFAGEPQQSTSETEEADRPEGNSISRDPIVGVGDDIVAELLGLATVEVDTSSTLLVGDTGFDGVLAAFNLHTRSLPDDVLLPIDERDEVAFFDHDGEKHTPYAISETPLSTTWQTHDPQNRQQVRGQTIDIRIQGTSKYVAAVGISSPSDISCMEIERYTLQLDLDIDLSSDVLGLPSDLEKNVESDPGVAIVSE